jgi:transposase
MDALFSFYNFENCAQDRWEDFVSRKAAIDEAVNILINGGKKYNGCRAKTRRKRKERPSRKRRRRAQRKRRKAARQSESMDEGAPPPPPSEPITANKRRRYNYTPAITDKMPLVVFGSAMFGKDGVRIKGHRHGITDTMFKQLKHRESLGELCLLTIDEYFTSQVCSKCKTRNLEKVADSNGKKLHAVLRCLTCNTLTWNRDVMASKNMWDISWSIWRGEGRPEEFKPLAQQQQQQQQQQQ